MRLGALQQIEFFFQLGGLLLLQIFFQPLQPLFDLAQVADDEVEIHVLDIAQRIDAAHVRNGGIVKGAHHVRQRIHAAQAGGEGGLFQRLFADGGHVHVFHRGMNGFFWVVESSELVEPLIGNFCHAHMRLFRIQIGAGLEASLGQDLEQRSLAHLRQADDAGFHSAIVSYACRTLNRILNIKGFTTKDTKMQKPRASPQRTRRSQRGWITASR